MSTFFQKSRALAYACVFILGFMAAFSVSLFVDQREMIHQHVSHESGEVAWVVFLKGDANKDVIEESIRSFPGIHSIHLISSLEAMEAAKNNPALSKSLSFTGRNPFPDSFDVRWDPFFLRKDFLAHVTKTVSSLKGVDKIGYDKPRVKRLTMIQRVLSIFDLTVLGLMWVTALLLVILTGRLLFFTRGPFPKHQLILSVAIGFLGGSLGSVLSQRFVLTFSWHVLWSGAVIGLLLVLWQSAFQDQ